ncbi:MAG: hypothetical protein NZ739_08180, partial [Verrucomicrobiae bacterium]|nr:hypothetical protein [Verrucomicrobiae bacterium]
MTFDRPELVAQLCWELRQADLTRSNIRARINSLYNGNPPYTEEERKKNKVYVNVNYLEGTRILHDARAQFYAALLKPSNFFIARLDYKPAHKALEYSHIVTQEINRIMKRSLQYYECIRSKVALDVLHGIGPCVWPNRTNWCPYPIGVEDVFVPSDTLVSLENLHFFALYRVFTLPELVRILQTKLNPGWNTDLIERIIKTMEDYTRATRSAVIADWYNPEKFSERIKSDGSVYAFEAVPRLGVFDFYFWSDADNKHGWRRRMVVDTFGGPGTDPDAPTRTRPDLSYAQDQFLFTSGPRIVADDVKQIVSFQFADLSAVAPFKYHSVRSLGFLLYSVCHLQNRLRCKFDESVFQALMPLFRVRNVDDVQRLVTIQLHNMGIIPENLQFVPAAERFQINAALIELALREKERLIREHSSAFIPSIWNPAGIQRTKFEVEAQLQLSTSLVSAALQQAYFYQRLEYEEIFRRFLIPDSPDPDVQLFRASVLRKGVPEEVLNPELWSIEAEQIVGGGNRALEIAIWERLMGVRAMFDPGAQRIVLREYVQALTESSALANKLVPEEQEITDSAKYATLVFGALMNGAQLSIGEGENHQEIIEGLISSLAAAVQRFQAAPDELRFSDLAGAQNVINHILQRVVLL